MSSGGRGRAANYDHDEAVVVQTLHTVQLRDGTDDVPVSDVVERMGKAPGRDAMDRLRAKGWLTDPVGSGPTVSLTGSAKLHTKQNWLHAVRRRDAGKSARDRFSAMAFRIAMLRSELVNGELVSFLDDRTIVRELGLADRGTREMTYLRGHEALTDHGWMADVGETANGHPRYLLTLGW